MSFSSLYSCLSLFHHLSTSLSLSLRGFFPYFSTYLRLHLLLLLFIFISILSLVRHSESFCLLTDSSFALPICYPSFHLYSLPLDLSLPLFLSFFLSFTLSRWINLVKQNQHIFLRYFYESVSQCDTIFYSMISYDMSRQDTQCCRLSYLTIYIPFDKNIRIRLVEHLSTLPFIVIEWTLSKLF